MPVVLGFDPGGLGSFGWCTCHFAQELPLTVIDIGIADNAREAVLAAIAAVPANEQVLGAGIDSPLCWVFQGDRASDNAVRLAIQAAGAPVPWGTVQAVNALRGACLVQGVLALHELRAVYPEILVTEAHPKALLWLLGIANANLPVIAVGPAHIPALVFPRQPVDHERDAALGAFAAWAATTAAPGWIDLVPLEIEPFYPAGPVCYFMPLAE